MRIAGLLLLLFITKAFAEEARAFYAFKPGRILRYTLTVEQNGKKSEYSLTEECISNSQQVRIQITAGDLWDHTVIMDKFGNCKKDSFYFPLLFHVFPQYPFSSGHIYYYTLSLPDGVYSCRARYSGTENQKMNFNYTGVSEKGKISGTIVFDISKKILYFVDVFRVSENGSRIHITKKL